MIRFKIKIHPHMEKSYTKTYMISNMNDATVDDIETYVEGVGNYILEDAVDLSKFYMLYNWEIVEITNNASLGFESFKAWYFKLHERNKPYYKDVYDNCWIDLNGVCTHVVSGHNTTAYNIIDSGKHSFKDAGASGTEVLESNGYIRCSRIMASYTKDTTVFFKDMEHEPTRNQWNAIIKICSKYGFIVPTFKI